VAPAGQVTYQVDMSVQVALGNFNPATDTVFVSGNFSNPDWLQTSTDGASGFVLAQSVGDPDIYEGTFTPDIPGNGSENHKFVINPDDNFSSVQWESSIGNRSFQVPPGNGSTTLPVVFFDDVDTLPSGPAVTFQVDMSVQRQFGNFNPANSDTVIVAGTFSTTDWTTTSVLTQSGADSNVYVGSFANDVPADDWANHKFIINPGGNSPANELLWESRPNRPFQVSSGSQTLAVVYFDDTTNSPSPPGAPIEFIAGADMSHVKFFEDRGISYRAGGQSQDVFAILKDRGLNCVRLRLFTSSAAQASANPYNYINNLDYTLPLAVRVKAAGLKLLLDIHYSDTWADPNDQLKPAAWTNLNFNQLQQRIHDYSSNSIAALKAAGAMPDYVQVGNEIIGGMLWDDGRVAGGFDNSGQWNNLGVLMKAAINGIHGAAGATPPRIIIHIDRGGDWGATRWFFDKLDQEAVPYDIIGQSFYSWWHGNFNDLQFCLSNTALRYGKPVVVMETAFPWNTNAGFMPGLGIPLTPEGQVSYTVALAEIVKGLPNGLGGGIYWWGSEYVQLNGYSLAGFHNASFFDYQGNVLPAVETLGQLTSEVALTADLDGGKLLIQWPLSGAGMSLTTTTSPAPATLWTNVTNPVTNVSGTYGVTLPAGPSPQQLYRLESAPAP
jgi:arabinogalactan endo-1,4-beta-galactosidase